MLLTVGLFAISLTAQVPHGRPVPVQFIQSADWRFLPSDYIDVMEGAFHDSVTGAFISVRAGLRSMASSAVPDVAKKYRLAPQQGAKGEWVYSYVVASYRARARSRQCEGRSGPLSQIEASFVSKAEPDFVWNFSAIACDTEERERSLQFLLENQSLWASHVRHDRDLVFRLRKESMSSLKLGTCLDVLRPILGLPFSVERRGQGFDLMFTLAESDGLLRVSFDRRACLTKSQFEPGDPVSK